MKDKLSNGTIRYAVYAVFAAVVVLTAYYFIRTPDVSMRIFYTPGLEADTRNSIMFDMGDGYQEKQVIRGAFDAEHTSPRRAFELFLAIPAEYRNPTGMTLVLQSEERDGEQNIIQIKAIELYNNHISVAKYAPQDLFEMFTFDGAEDVYVDKDRLCITAGGETTSMTAKDAFLQEYREVFGVSQYLIYNLLLLWALLWAGLILLDRLIPALRRRERAVSGSSKSTVDMICLVMQVILFAAVICVFYMALKSQHYAHPDEDVTRLAIDYYMGGWIPPDIRSRAAMGTFSNYGYTRLDENTLYYLLAGKVGWLSATFLHIRAYYRVFNLLLFLIMAAMMFVKRKKHSWMIIALGITPQIWYLFSYATSDAFDYFISFQIVYQLLEQDSILNKLLSKKAKRPYFNVLFCGVLFNMLLRGKQNYYLILLFALCILLIRLWKAQRAEKIGLLQRYLLILFCSFLLLGTRIGVNYHYYGASTAGIVGEKMVELNAADAYRPSVMAETGKVISQAGEGRSIVDVFTMYGKDIVTGLIWSGVGNYGWLEYPHMRIYGYLLFGLYSLVCCFIMTHMIRDHKKEGVRDSILLAGFIGLAYGMVLYICWSSDFQTQGRYVLLLCPIVAYYSAGCRQLSRNIKFHLLLLILCVCSIYSFMGNGLYHLAL